MSEQPVTTRHFAPGFRNERRANGSTAEGRCRILDLCERSLRRPWREANEPTAVVDIHGFLSIGWAYVARPSESDGDVHLMPNGQIMPLTVTAASTVAPPPPDAPPPAKKPIAKGAAQPSAASAAASSAQQQAALNQMLATYARDQSHGTDARTLSALGKQIMTAAKALGQHVTLPRAPASAGAASASPEANAAPEKGKVNVTA